MAIDNPSIIDGMAMDNENNAIVLLLTDYLPWNGENELISFAVIADK
ncbi:hypothetical protein [Pseudobutyrivibrio sp.]